MCFVCATQGVQFPFFFPPTTSLPPGKSPPCGRRCYSIRPKGGDRQGCQMHLPFLVLQSVSWPVPPCPPRTGSSDKFETNVTPCPHHPRAVSICLRRPRCQPPERSIFHFAMVSSQLVTALGWATYLVGMLIVGSLAYNIRMYAIRGCKCSSTLGFPAHPPCPHRFACESRALMFGGPC